MIKLNLFLLFRHNTMNQEKLAKLQAQVRIGGKVRKPPEMFWKHRLKFLERQEKNISRLDQYKFCVIWPIVQLPEMQVSFSSQMLDEQFRVCKHCFNSVTCCDLWELQLSSPVGCSSSAFLVSLLGIFFFVPASGTGCTLSCFFSLS